MKSFKKVLAYALAATLALGSCTTALAATASVENPKTTPVKQENASAKMNDSISVKVDTTRGGNAAITNVTSNKATIKLTTKIKVGNVKYDVKIVRANAFANATRATKVSIPASVTVQKNAFKGAKKLKTVRLRISKANQIKVKKGAFAGLNTSKMTVRVNKDMSKKALNNLKKALKNAGFKGKVLRVK